MSGVADKIRNFFRVGLVDDWKRAHTFLSVQLLALGVVLLQLEPSVPELQNLLPEGWVKWLMVAIAAARILKVAGSKNVSDSVADSKPGLGRVPPTGGSSDGAPSAVPSGVQSDDS